MSKKTKIAIVGPIPRDKIITHKGDVIKKYGCVTHPVIALAKLLENDGEVFPISHIHKIDEAPIKKIFHQHTNIKVDGIYTHKDKGTVIELKFLDQNNRKEQQRSKMEPIKKEDIEKFTDVDAFVFVPITDFEIELGALQYIKKNSKATVIFDAHGPTTWINDKGERLRKFWKDKNKWFPYIDVLKMNLEESQFSWLEDEKILTSYDENYTDHLDDFAEDTLRKGVKILFVTLDSRGCVTYQFNNDTLQKDWIPSVKVTNVIDTTGCGDSFAGGLAYGLTCYNDPIKAAQYANVLGALRTQGKDFQVFKNKQETDRILRENYKEEKLS
ncbi:carbohydrate kinase family protein [Galbibacter sp. PAP.153]|uniref:carbohydrate kinase family protein n=1 Tax=Galbibacter sp. PAP.153 TaxID=3104623 RepID=UPI00300A0CA5